MIKNDSQNNKENSYQNILKKKKIFKANLWDQNSRISKIKAGRKTS
jgi:hypothetical protein